MLAEGTQQGEHRSHQEQEDRQRVRTSDVELCDDGEVGEGEQSQGGTPPAAE